MRRIRTILICTVCLIGATAQAQWQWLDNSGRKVFSDQPPPIDIPVKNILKEPGKAATTPTVSQAAPSATTAASGPATAPAVPVLSDGDKELLARKKKAEADAQAKVTAQADRLAQAKAANCEKARAKQTLMDSGVRVSITNANGEREILDDAMRASERKKILAVISANCQ